jgi:hypothetical protein
VEEHRSTQCTHHWLLSEPDMGSVQGTCRRCGARRTYPSSVEIPEAIPDYEELDAGPPVLAAEAPSTEEHALV